MLVNFILCSSICCLHSCSSVFLASCVLHFLFSMGKKPGGRGYDRPMMYSLVCFMFPPFSVLPPFHMFLSFVACFPLSLSSLTDLSVIFSR